MITIPKLDGRLSAAAAFVRNGAVLADIGTDHAYLPIFLYRTGTIARAVAADIAEAPIQKAREHIAACGCTHAIAAVQTNGLHGIAPYEPTDIAICGMGGMLIAEIIGNAPFVQDPNIRLILQPMTMQPYLRTWLTSHSFSIDAETIAAANGKLYPILCCHYANTITALTPAQALLGPFCIAHNKELPLFSAYLASHIAALEKIIAGKASAGLDVHEEIELLSQMTIFTDSSHMIE